MQNIQPIVEGHGDVPAVPILIRRLIAATQTYELEVGRPIRQPRGRLVKEDSLRRAVKLALKQPGCAAILVLFDGDDDCPKELVPALRTWARSESGRVPCEIVVAKREYEAWFLASLESLRGSRGIRADASPPGDPESVRGAKELLEAHMACGSYFEKIDQPSLTSAFDMAAAYSCRSFRQMVTAFGRLAAGAGHPIADWPPASWSP